MAPCLANDAADASWEPPLCAKDERSSLPEKLAGGLEETSPSGSLFEHDSGRAADFKAKRVRRAMAVTTWVDVAGSRQDGVTAACRRKHLGLELW